MSTDQPSGDDYRGHQTDAEAHPERALDELEERVLGRRMDQAGLKDKTEAVFGRAPDEDAPGTEQP
jgi:hypothetical protein